MADEVFFFAGGAAFLAAGAFFAAGAADFLAAGLAAVVFLAAGAFFGAAAFLGATFSLPEAGLAAGFWYLSKY